MRVRGLIGPRTINVQPPAVTIQPPAITVNASPREPEDLLEASLEVAQTQLLAQLAEETNIDGQAIGIVAFLGALLAVDVAAKGILGRWWWTPLVVVGVAVLPCLGSLYAGAPLLGPRGFEFYRTYGGHPSRLAREQLLADLDAAFGKNASRAKAKRLRLRLARRYRPESASGGDVCPRLSQSRLVLIGERFDPPTESFLGGVGATF
jgi:hypothetical protein